MIGIVDRKESNFRCWFPFLDYSYIGMYRLCGSQGARRSAPAHLAVAEDQFSETTPIVYNYFPLKPCLDRRVLDCILI
jgi:hypothetical protein